MICLKIRTFVVSATTHRGNTRSKGGLWFAWKFVPLWYQQQLMLNFSLGVSVVICLKIRTFVVSATTLYRVNQQQQQLWFAWKFVPLWYQQQLCPSLFWSKVRCDLLENSYLCGISNNIPTRNPNLSAVVICLKIRTFVVSATTMSLGSTSDSCCDLLENSYLCGISNNFQLGIRIYQPVVICLKIRTFVVSATTTHLSR